MLKYITKRILTSIVTIWAVITISFFLIKIMPGGPFNSDKMTPEIRANLEAKYGLDKPLAEQYTMYLSNLLKGDLGESMQFKGRQVKDTIKNSFPNSAKVGSVAIVVSLIGGVLLGVLAALKSGKWQDRVVMLIATLGITVPSFVISAGLIYIFTSKLKLLQPLGISRPENYIMPVIALSLSSVAFITRLTRNKMIDVMKSDYIRTAKAKGLSKKTVVFKHALRNSLIPFITYVGPLIASVLTGSFVVERIFAIPGLGNEFISTITARDYSAALGVIVFYGTLIIVFNLLVDLMYVVVDPRIKLDNIEG